MKNKFKVLDNEIDNIEHINSEEREMALNFADEIINGQVTHAVIAYRRLDGDIRYILLNNRHQTYLIGLIERVKSYIMSLL